MWFWQESTSLHSSVGPSRPDWTFVDRLREKEPEFFSYAGHLGAGLGVQ